MIVEKTLKTTGKKGKQKKRYIYFGLKEDFEDGEVIVQHKEEYYLQQEEYQKLQEEYQKLQEEYQKLQEEYQKLQEELNTHSTSEPKENNISIVTELKNQNQKEVEYLKRIIKEYKQDNEDLQEKVQTLTEKSSSERNRFIIILSSLANENPIKRLFTNKAKSVINELKNNENYLQDKKVFQTIEASNDLKKD